ncbi:unnamed protein product [Brachionus calyciflorus]|uniref:PH domain-containing protein n=1 Tax=Brachionus calyciflorus TaxID=104777 RepID=A0A814S693_9BILA|nr:unnamed protein product [Brachionus calyciflorus]
MTASEREEAVKWFNGLENGIQILFDHEIDRLIVVRRQMLEIQNNCPGYVEKAVFFAKQRRPESISDNNILFNSVESTAYHMIINPVESSDNYVKAANGLVASYNCVIQRFELIKSRSAIDLKFVDPNDGS